MMDRESDAAVRIGHARPQPVYVTAATLQRQVAKHVVKRAVLEQQHHNVLDPFKTAGLHPS